MVSGLRWTTYQERLIELDLLSLEDRHTLHDQVQLYKILHGVDRVNYRTWFTLVQDVQRANTRLNNHPLNIVPRRTNLDIYKHFFSNRVVPVWNGLDSEMKDRGSVNAFREKMKKYLKHRRLG